LNTRLEVAIKEVPRQFLEGWVTETLYAHKICYTPERQQEEKRQHKKEQIDILIASKKQAKSFRQKQSLKNQESLAVSIISGIILGIIVGGSGGAISHFVFGFGSSWQSATIWGFCSVSILTIVTILILSFLD
jgi:hypothetical protein